MGAGRRPAPQALRPDPEPRRDGQGLRRARARDLRRGDGGAHAPRSRRRASQQQAQAENVLTAAIGRLFAVAEAYPQLRATENFQQLQAQLADVEQNIAVSRQVYNDTVLTYDNALETVPTNIIAGHLQLPAARVLRDRGGARRGRRPAVQLLQPDARLGSRASSPLVARRRCSWPSRPAQRASRTRCRTADVAVRDRARRLAARRASTSRSTSRRLHAARTATSRSARASRSTASRVSEGGTRYTPGRRAPSSAASARPDTFGVEPSDEARPDRLALPGRRASARTFTICVPLPRARGRLRRRRRRQPAGLGRRTGRAGSATLTRDDARCPRPTTLGAALPRLGPAPSGCKGVVDAHAEAAHAPRGRTSRRTSSSRCASSSRARLLTLDRGREGRAGQRARRDRRRGGATTQATTSTTARRSTTRSDHLGRTLLFLLLLGVGPGARRS